MANVLACAFALLADDEAHAAYTPFTVVDQAVSAIAARREVAFAKGLTNAVLRNFLRERDTLIANAEQSEVARWNYPQWWIDAVKRGQPGAWERILAAGNVQGPLTLRVNTRHATVDEYLARLNEAGIDADQAGAQAVRLKAPMPVDRIPGFADGVVSVQDAGAQLAAQALDARDGMRVLDACAAPGGKTDHILELANVELIALESDAERVTRIGQNLTRLKLNADIKVGDAGDPSQWLVRRRAVRPHSRGRAVLGVGHREIGYCGARRGTAPHSECAVAARREGRRIAYVTCLIFPEEGEEQARWFGSLHEDAVRLDAPGQLLPVAAPREANQSAAQDSPDGTNTSTSEMPRAGQSSNRPASAFADYDGFFYARFQKR